MSENTLVGDDAIVAARAFVGATVAEVHRVLYSFGGAVEPDDGALQLTFDQGHILRLDGAADGERLACALERWRDPFTAEKMTPENQTYLEEHGKWGLVELTHSEPWSRIVGEQLLSVEPIGSRFGVTIGALLSFTRGEVVIYVQSDETRVVWGREGLPNWGKGTI